MRPTRACVALRGCDRRIADLWLACHTEEEIAKTVGIPRQTINDHIRELPKTDIWQKSAIFSTYADLWLACYTEVVGIPVGTIKGTKWLDLDIWQNRTIFSTYTDLLRWNYRKVTSGRNR